MAISKLILITGALSFASVSAFADQKLQGSNAGDTECASVLARIVELAKIETTSAIYAMESALLIPKVSKEHSEAEAKRYAGLRFDAEVARKSAEKGLIEFCFADDAK